jgi:hypothetical protein
MSALVHLNAGPRNAVGSPKRFDCVALVSSAIPRPMRPKPFRHFPAMREYHAFCNRMRYGAYRNEKGIFYHEPLSRAEVRCVPFLRAAKSLI